MVFKGTIGDIANLDILNRIVEDDRSIERTLVRRGYSFKSNKTGLSKRLLLDIDILKEEEIERFYHLMSHESNRAILKKICVNKSDFTKAELYDKWNTTKVDDFFKELLDLKAIIKNNDDSFSIKKRKVEFGENLEWYISEVFRRELYCTSDWGVHIIEAPSGGDYDVLSRAENNIIYVECKAQKSSNIEDKDLINFLKRDEFLRPYISIFLIDTTEDIYVVEKLFNNIGLKIKKLITKHGIKFTMGNSPYTERLNNLFFHFQNRLFIVNSKKPILKTIKLCLRYRYRTGELDQAFKGRFWLHELLLKVERWW